MRAVRAIGLSGQMHGAVLLDAAGEVLRPAILWNDGRSAAAVRRADARACRACAQIAGNLAMPGFTAPKLLWVRDHEPADLRRRSPRCCCPRTGCAVKLSGEFFSDMLRRVGHAVAGRRRARLVGRAARRLRHDARADAGAGRRQRARGPPEAPTSPSASACPPASSSPAAAATTPPAPWAWARRAPGDGFVSLGTSGVIFLCSDRFLPRPESAVHAFCHALPGRWHQMSVMLSAASALRWVTQLTDRRDEAELLGRGRGARRTRAATRRRCSCPTWPASARRTTTRRRRACCSA